MELEIVTIAAKPIGGCTWCRSFFARGTGGPIGARSPLKIVGGLVLPGTTRITHTIDQFGPGRTSGAFVGIICGAPTRITHTIDQFGPGRTSGPFVGIVCGARGAR